MRSNRDIEAELVELKRVVEATLKQVNRALHEIRRRPDDEPADASRVPAREESLSSPSQNYEYKEKKEETRAPELPANWKEWAAADRRRAGLVEVDLDAEWQKMLKWDHGKPVRIGRWLWWSFRAWRDHTNAPKSEVSDDPEVEKSAPAAPAADPEAVRAEIRDRAHLREFFRTARWPENRGPKPGEAGCRYPEALIAQVAGRCFT